MDEYEIVSVNKITKKVLISKKKKLKFDLKMRIALKIIHLTQYVCKHTSDQ